jgi:antitoxin (DNA-binding transcriptional repressor) of toxin-antitoxin stability system
MKTVNVAELKSQLSAYLSYVKGGEEILVKERNKPIAKIVPLNTTDADQQLVALASAGILKLPEIPGGIPVSLRSAPRTRLVRTSMSDIMKKERDGR